MEEMTEKVLTKTLKESNNKLRHTNQYIATQSHPSATDYNMCVCVCVCTRARVATNYNREEEWIINGFIELTQP